MCRSAAVNVGTITTCMYSTRDFNSASCKGSRVGDDQVMWEKVVLSTAFEQRYYHKYIVQWKHLYFIISPEFMYGEALLALLVHVL